MRGRTAVWLCLVAFCSLWLSTACNSERPGDYVFLENDEAVMPVWTRGETDSGTFVVHVHGGPGNSSIALGHDRVFRAIEQEAAVVYWDQRGAGNSQGNPAPDSLTVDQYAEDLGEVVTLVQQRHGVDELFLMSHGFGVNIAAEYLSRGDHQQQVAGWVFVDGNFDLPMSIGMSRQWLLGLVDGQIEAGKQTAHWQEIRNWYEDHPVIDSGAEYRQHRRYLRELNAFKKPDGYQRPVAKRAFDSPSSILAETIDRNRTQQIYWNRSSSLTLDTTDTLAQITVPTLVLWGQDDGLTPLPMSKEALRALGTDEEASSRVVLRESAHRPELDQPAEFTSEVNAFIESYR